MNKNAMDMTWHMGYYINRYAGWFKVVHFTSELNLVRWLKANSDKVETIDFITHTPIK